MLIEINWFLLIIRISPHILYVSGNGVGKLNIIIAV